MTIQSGFAAVVSDDPSVLDAIDNRAHSLAMWRRATSLDVSSLMACAAKNVRLPCRADAARGPFRAALLAQGHEEGGVLEAFVEDVAGLAVRFAQACGSSGVKIRLERVTTNSCRKFHADYTTMRLITTYRGPGTQWIEGADVRRVAAGDEPETIHELSTGDVGIFKGRLLVDEPSILHRSPPIAGQDIARLLLVIDPADEAE